MAKDPWFEALERRSRELEEQNRRRCEEARELSNQAWAHRCASHAAEMAEIRWRNSDPIVDVDFMKKSAYEKTMNSFGYYQRWLKP